MEAGVLLDRRLDYDRTRQDTIQYNNQHSGRKYSLLIVVKAIVKKLKRFNLFSYSVHTFSSCAGIWPQL